MEVVILGSWIKGLLEVRFKEVEVKVGERLESASL